VLSARQRDQVATINYAFEPPAAGDLEEEQIFLDPLNPQSDLSEALLALFEQVLEDEAYRRRLEQHYDLMKESSAVRRIVAPAHHTIVPLRRTLTAEERAREANRRKRQRQKARKQRR
jgi:hypothetical protein